MEFLTDHELLTVLKAAKSVSTRDWLMILMTYNHGMRREEVCQLRLGDIDAETRELCIARLKGSRRTTQPLMPHVGQPLLDEVKGLKLWLAERPLELGDALFPSEKGGCMSGRNFAYIYERYARAAGLPESKQNPHTLKHTLANHLVRSGMHLAAVQTRLGHAKIDSTMKYIAISDREAAVQTHNALMSRFKAYGLS